MSKKQFKYSLIDNLTGNSPKQYKKNSKEEIRQALIDDIILDDLQSIFTAEQFEIISFDELLKLTNYTLIMNNPINKLCELDYEVRYLKKQVQVLNKEKKLVLSIDKYYNPNDPGYYKELNDFIEKIDEYKTYAT